MTEFHRPPRIMPNIDPRLNEISRIASKADFSEWARGVLNDIQENPDNYTKDRNALKFINEMWRFSQFESTGFFANNGIPEPTNPEAWRLLAYAVYFCTPGPD
jgi:hypothetical protein